MSLEKLKWHHFLIMPSIVIYDALLRKTPEQKKREEDNEKATFRNFRVEIQSGFFGNKVKLIQREKPLTDEEMELMYKDVTTK